LTIMLVVGVISALAVPVSADDSTCALADQLPEAFKPLDQIPLDVVPKQATPPDCYSELQGNDEIPARLHDQRSENHHAFHWAASKLQHQPLYFEDVPLERYGQTHSPILQPAISGLYFAKQTVTLPYRIGLDPPCQREYTLGYPAAPGSCAPSLGERLPWSWPGAILQTGAVLGTVFMFP